MMKARISLLLWTHESGRRADLSDRGARLRGSNSPKVFLAAALAAIVIF